MFRFCFESLFSLFLPCRTAINTFRFLVSCVMIFSFVCFCCAFLFFFFLCFVATLELERLQSAAWLKQEGGKLFKAAKYQEASERSATDSPYFDALAMRCTDSRCYFWLLFLSSGCFLAFFWCPRAKCDYTHLAPHVAIYARHPKLLQPLCTAASPFRQPNTWN